MFSTELRKILLDLNLVVKSTLVFHHRASTVRNDHDDNKPLLL